MRITKIISESPHQTQKIGLKLAKKLRGKEIIGLVGELGAGKTCLVKGITQGLKAKKLAKSPSFVILNQYPVLKNKKIKIIFHWDLYRLKNWQELQDLGFKEILNKPNTVSVIEWADKIKKRLPKGTWWVYFKVLTPQQREIQILK